MTEIFVRRKYERDRVQGKRIGNNEWIYGYLRQTGHENIEKPNGQYIKTVKYYQIQDNKYNSQFVNEETIGQYTGLKDKNGKKIYEGDVVQIIKNVCSQYNPIENYIVTFERGSYRLVKDFVYIHYLEYKINNHNRVYIDELSRRETRLFRRKSEERFEIIGNVYDNPELIDKNKILYGKQEDNRV